MKKGRKIFLIVILAIVVIAAAGAGYMMYKINGLSTMTFEDMIEYTTNDNPDAVIAVGIIKDGQTDIMFYGENGKVVENKGYEFEIGSITKTFTASLLCKMINEGEMNLEDNIDVYLDLPQKDYYPKLSDMVTHTSGYKGHYIDKTMRSNIFSGEGNSYTGIVKEELLEQLADNVPKDKSYSYKYSNFGVSVVGQAIADELGTDYASAMNSFISDDLELNNTRISDGTGNMDGYWTWTAEDAYMPAGAIISTIEDMAEYLNMHMAETLPYLVMSHEPVESVNVSNAYYGRLNIHIDDMAVCWVIDNENNVVWHNGGTSEFNAYAGFDKDKQIGVVILSNSPPAYRIPTTVMGMRLIKDLQEE